MSSINFVSMGSFPAVPQPVIRAVGAAPASTSQVSGAQSQDTGQPVTPAQLQKVIDRMNRQMSGSNQSLRIGYASDVHQLTVEVVDNTTGQVVGQFPSKAMLAGEAAMNQFIGMMLSKEA